ncbi:MAG: MotA/TolQ/ExbB proton channel family protein [Pirellulaceae bacterium]
MKTASLRSLSISSLIIPTALGGALYLIIAALLDGHIIESEIAVRYLVGHPISRTTTFLFCIGLMSLIGIWWNVLRQSRTLDSIVVQPEALTSPSREENDRDMALELQNQLESMPPKFHEHGIWQRLHKVFQYIQRNGSTANIESELKYESEMALEEQQQRLSFVKILIWATPMLGFLGTVIGISQALGQLNVGPDNNLQSMMANLQSSLYVAFDTTAQALLLSMFLMFAMFFVERLELGHLHRVEQGALAQLARVFEFNGQQKTAVDEHVERLGRKMLASTRAAVGEHTRIWKKTIESAEQAWVTTQTQVSAKTQQEVTEALKSAFTDFANQLQVVSRNSEESIATRVGQWQTLLSDTSRAIQSQQHLNQSQCAVLGEILQELSATRTAFEREFESRESLHQTAMEHVQVNRDSDAAAQKRWDEMLAEQGKLQEIQHHRFQQEMKLFQEMTKRLDLAHESIDAKHTNESKKFKEGLIEIVSLMQLMKDELVQLHQDRNHQKEQIFRLQIADHTRKAA